MTLNRDRLRFFSPFSTLSGDYLDKVLDKAKVLDVPKGKIIFPRGKTLPDSLYLLEGEVDLVSASFERSRSEEHTSELQSRGHLVCRLLLEKKKNITKNILMH